MKDIEKNNLLKMWIANKINDGDYHRLELAALDDPFLFDAMEGITLNRLKHDENTHRILSKIDTTITKKKKRRMPYLAAAAGISGLLFAAYFLFDKEVKISQSTPKNDFALVTDDIKTLKNEIEKTKVEDENSVSPTSKELEGNPSFDKSENQNESSQIHLNKVNEKSNERSTSIVSKMPSEISQASGEIPQIEAIDTEAQGNLANVAEESNSLEEKIMEVKVNDIHTSVQADKSMPSKNPAPMQKASKESIVRNSPSNMNPLTLSGVVKNAKGELLNGASIISQLSSVITNGDGAFTIFLPHGRNFIIVTAPNHETEGFYINETQKIDLSLKLIPSLEVKSVVENYYLFNYEVQRRINNYLRQNKIEFNDKVTCYIKVENSGEIKDVVIIEDYSQQFTQQLRDWIVECKNFLPKSARGEILTTEFLQK